MVLFRLLNIDWGSDGRVIEQSDLNSLLSNVISEVWRENTGHFDIYPLPSLCTCCTFLSLFLFEFGDVFNDEQTFSINENF